MSTDIEWSPTAVKPNIDILDTQLNFADLPLILGQTNLPRNVSRVDLDEK